jgi:hypothetical protein
LLCSAALPTALSVVMLGPLLVALAHEFQTSVAVVGQLAAAAVTRLKVRELPASLELMARRPGHTAAG